MTIDQFDLEFLTIMFNDDITNVHRQFSSVTYLK